MAKRISGAATHLGKLITMSSRDRDRALDKLSYEVSDELHSLDITAKEIADVLRVLNCTLAAIAISDNHQGARLYLETASGGRYRSPPPPDTQQAFFGV